MDFFRGIPVVQQRKIATGETNDFGKDIFETVEFIIENVIVSQKTASVLEESLSIKQETTLQLILPEGSEVLPGDSFFIQGEQWLLDSPGNDFYQLEIQSRFIPRPTVVNVKKVKGDS